MVTSQACPPKSYLMCASAGVACHAGAEQECIDMKAINTEISTSPYRALLGSLLLRASYGGMAGDVALMLSSCKLWFHRFTTLSQQGPVDEAMLPQKPQSSTSEEPWLALWDTLFPASTIPWVVCASM
jgi:hypothetical protein